MKKFSFIKNKNTFFIIVAAVVVIGIISFFVNGFNMDIDFVGGTEISYTLGQSITTDEETALAGEIKNAIGAENFSSLRVSGERDTVTVRTLVADNSDNSDELSAIVEQKMSSSYPQATLVEGSTATSKGYVLTDENTEDDVTPAWTEEDVNAVKALLADIDGLNVSAQENALYIDFSSTSVVSALRSDVTDVIAAKYENAKWRSTDTVSSEISSGLRESAILATVVAVILMLIYIAFRFEVSSAFAAIVCLAHDLFVMLVAYSIFQIPVNSTIIAALLTILGYSINATIIIFDRIRENDRKFTNAKFAEKVDDGIKSTFTRSLNTTLTTLFTIGMIYILGVTSIKNFALPIIVGILAGLFSSVCLAGPLWYAFKNLKNKKKTK